MAKKIFKILIFVLALRSNIAISEGMSFFSEGIDYWGQRGSAQKDVPQNEEVKPEEQPKSFSWEKYLDPKHDEFFREGDHIPPEPFMEIVRNPTDENLRLWFAYIDRKNELAERLSRRMQEFSEKHILKKGSQEHIAVQENIESISQIPPDRKRYRFRLYFDSKCPHCHKMLGTISGLHNKGFLVEAKQIDKTDRSKIRLPVPVSFAEKSEIEKYQIDSVPVLLIGDLEAKRVYRLRGYLSEQEIFKQIY